jgi:hypothetical protein
MLGRLEMDVTSCIDAYLKISEGVFHSRKRSILNMLGKARDMWHVQGKFDYIPVILDTCYTKSKYL